MFRSRMARIFDRAFPLTDYSFRRPRLHGLAWYRPEYQDYRTALVPFNLILRVGRIAWIWLLHPFPPLDALFQLDEKLQCWHAIQKLTRDECTSVEIHNPNPDFGGPSYCVTWRPDTMVTNEELDFYGETYLECLKKALLARDLPASERRMAGEELD